jgi:VanZ family protein
MLKIIFNYSFLCAVAWTAVIFGLCCMPGRYVPTADWLELLSFDKFVHASIFFCLTCLWLMYLYRINRLTRTTILLTWLLCILYGGLLEVMQATVFSQRSADWLDFMANSFGCTMGLWFFFKKQHLLLKYHN